MPQYLVSLAFSFHGVDRGLIVKTGTDSSIVNRCGHQRSLTNGCPVSNNTSKCCTLQNCHCSITGHTGMYNFAAFTARQLRILSDTLTLESHWPSRQRRPHDKFFPTRLTFMINSFKSWRIKKNISGLFQNRVFFGCRRSLASRGKEASRQ